VQQGQARINLNRNNWDYLIGGSETETTLARNRAALDAWGFRPRVLRDVSNVDCSRTFFGKKLRIPRFAPRSAGLKYSSRGEVPPSPRPAASSATG
jgi:isopentenyl diphosphate isomerase/L-lactate dehydrogenase-like FMN-dependent dehydrogenase